MGERTVELEVLRYNPETDSEPRFQRYTVTCREEWVVLDALNRIKETIDPTLTYRWSCHMAVCGSCGMMINKEPKLACKAFIRNYKGVIRVEPLAHFPIERDDKNFLRHSLAVYHPSQAPRVDYCDVVITKSQPGVRDYSGGHE